MISGLFINFFFIDRTFGGDSYSDNQGPVKRSFLHTLDVGDRHGARGPMGEHPGGDMLNNFLHF